MVENNLTLQRTRISGVVLIHDLWDSIDKREHPLAGGDCLLDLGVHSSQILDRPHQKGDVGDKCHDTAYSQAANLSLQAAVPDYGTQGEGTYHLHAGQKQCRQPGCPVAGAVHLTGQMAELSQVRLFSSKSFHHTHAGDVFIIRTCDLGVKFTRLSEFY
jgi:hypothetical protein